MMVKPMNGKERETLANILVEQRSLILGNWRDLGLVQSLLESKNISPDFFIAHFGSRVLDYFISVLHKKSAPGQCPVISVMLHFFNRRGLMLHEVFHICSGMRNTIVEVLLERDIKYSDDIYKITIELFELNFAGVIKEYIDVTFTKNQIIPKKSTLKAPIVCSAKTVQDASTPLVKIELGNTVLNEYFAQDADEGLENVLFLSDDADDMLEYFAEVPELLSLAVIDSDPTKIDDVAKSFSKVGSILLRYSPYLDSLASSMTELSSSIREHPNAFIEVLTNNNDDMLQLFDAVSIDMDRYIQRFSVESIAMKNAHHIHEPTTLSILQIISMFAPEEFEEGEIEFF